MNKKIGLYVMTITLLIHILLDFFYRPFIYENNIFDFHFANSFANLTSVIFISGMMVRFDVKTFYENKYMESLVVIVPVLAMIIYECIQPWLAWATFDLIDMLYSLLGGIIVFLLKRFVYDRFFKIMRIESHF